MTTASPTVLIIDDNVDLANLYARWLDDEYDVRTAYSGGSGIKQFDAEVGLVFLDRRMPDYSGSEVLDEIRSYEHTCPVVMLTAVEPDGDIVDLPFDRYLTKPVDRVELRDTVQQGIDRAESNYQNEVLDVLGDEKSRHCLSQMTDDTFTAKEIANATGYSLPTVYRRLNDLRQAELIEARTRIDAEGNRVKRFTAVVEQVVVDLVDGFQTEIKSDTES
ncbi:response regulator [Haloplanus halobius]|uniref:response regulator n=1 Tax=Haloplanus halobius TaxID=2934938 RepID=UPI00200F76C8|nr:response regulator [Haloplanus sp. XH21]